MINISRCLRNQFLNRLTLLINQSAASKKKPKTSEVDPNKPLLQKDIKYNPWQAIQLAKAHTIASFD